MEVQGALLSGVSVGLTVAAPIGPMAVIVIRRTLSNGFLVGFVTGAGASTIHGVYSALALGSLGHFAGTTPEARTLMGTITALVLVFFAFRMLMPRSRKVDVAGGHQSLLRHYASALAFCLVNPMTLTLMVATVTAISGMTSSNAAGSAALVGGVFSGSLLWWIGLVTMTATIGARFSPGWVRTIDIAAGMALLFLAVATIIRLF